MRKRDFERVMRTLGRLSPGQLRHATQRLADMDQASEALRLVNRRIEANPTCPHCGHLGPCSWGRTRSNVQRYRCAGCQRTFTALTGTAFARVHHKSKLLENAACMAEFLSVRKTARRLGVHRNTAFRLRHLMMPELAKHQPKALEGVAEADEMFFRRSYKGQKSGLPRPAHKRGSPAKKRGISSEQVPVFTVVARGSSQSLVQVLTSVPSASNITAALRPFVRPDTVLCSDSAGSYKTAAKDLGIVNRQIPRGSHKLGPYHIQNANALHSRFKGRMRVFRGVATKNLAQYLGWVRFFDRLPDGGAERFLLDALGVKS